MKNLFLFALCFCINSLWSSSISGTIIDKETRSVVAFVKIKVESKDTVAETRSDASGNYNFENLPSGVYNITARYPSYKTFSVFEQKLTSAKPLIINIEIEPNVLTLDTLSLDLNPFDVANDATDESPVSLRSLGSEEVERNPGGNRDVSRVIRNLPGVASTPSFRNDIIIRGGSPNENRFFLDGIEVPNINHFATQGASGGPVGLINVNFIKNVDFYSGAFPANRGNALSSVISFDLKDPRTDKFGYRATLGASDLGLTMEGPIAKNTSFMASVRRSYLQFLFKLIQLPFLPTYNDYQFKVKYAPNVNTELTIIGLGALDQFRLNASVNDGVKDPEVFRRNKYIIENIPINEQWNYTQGLRLVKYSSKGMKTYVLSRNMLNNKTFKYLDNDESKAKTIDYNSQEIENKARFEHLVYTPFADVIYTLNTEYAKYNTNTSVFRVINGEAFPVIYQSDIKLLKYGASLHTNKKYLSGKLITSIGFRVDANTFSKSLANPLDQFSPRASISYKITNQFIVSANTGIYSQMPNYTSLGFRDATGTLVNKDLKYIKNSHFVAGVKYLTKFNSSVSVESFLKNYWDYPFLVNDSVSIANLGSDFGVVGNDRVSSTSRGRAYGFEVLYQQKLTKGFFGILAYTYVNSSFSDRNDELKPSAWDSRNIVSASFGKKFKRNWQVGTKFSYSGGLPYTPYNIAASQQKAYWDIFRQGQLDLNQLNSLRLKPFHALDLRIDKEYFFKKWNIDIYLDIQNVYGFAAEQAPILDVIRDTNGNPIIANPEASIENQFYNTELLQTGSGNALPTIGVILDF